MSTSNSNPDEPKGFNKRKKTGENRNTDDAVQFPDQEDLESLQSMDIDQWLEHLQSTDRSLYNLMALEVWSIAKTMDDLFPGFWSRFMTNRKDALNQFIQLQKKCPPSQYPPADHPMGQKRSERPARKS